MANIVRRLDIDDVELVVYDDGSTAFALPSGLAAPSLGGSGADPADFGAGQVAVWDDALQKLVGAYGPLVAPRWLVNGYPLQSAWLAALNRQKLSGGAAKALLIGDSITYGTGAENGGPGGVVWTNRWADQLRAALKAKLGGVDWTYYPNNYAMTGGPVTVIGSLLAVGFGSYAFEPGAGKMTVTAIPGDRFIVVTYNQYQSTQIVKIDGATVATITPAGTQTVTFNGPYTATSGTHTVSVENGTGGNGYTIVLGVIGSTGDPAANGAHVLDYGAGGTHASNWAATPSDKSWREFIAAPFAPDVLDINLGTNDYLDQATLVSFKADMKTIIAYGQSLGAAVCVSGPLPYAGDLTIKQSDYYGVLEDLTVETNCALVDYRIKFPTPPPLSDSVHPNYATHTAMASAKAAVYVPA